MLSCLLGNNKYMRLKTKIVGRVSACCFGVMIILTSQGLAVGYATLGNHREKKTWPSGKVCGCLLGTGFTIHLNPVCVCKHM